MTPLQTHSGVGTEQATFIISAGAQTYISPLLACPQRYYLHAHTNGHQGTHHKRILILPAQKPYKPPLTQYVYHYQATPHYEASHDHII